MEDVIIESFLLYCIPTDAAAVVLAPDETGVTTTEHEISSSVIYALLLTPSVIPRTRQGRAFCTGKKRGVAVATQNSNLVKSNVEFVTDCNNVHAHVPQGAHPPPLSHVSLIIPPPLVHGDTNPEGTEITPP